MMCQEYHRIRGIGSILQPAGRRSRMRRARRLTAGMKGENIASTSTSFLLFISAQWVLLARAWLGGHAWVPSYGTCHSAVFPARVGLGVRLVHSV